MSEVLIDAAIALSTAAAVGCAISGTCADLVEDLMRKIQEGTKKKTMEPVDVCPPPPPDPCLTIWAPYCNDECSKELPTGDYQGMPFFICRRKCMKDHGCSL
jgi:hypothetical protein